jgi:MFS family permease
MRDRKWLALVAVALATFMTYLDNNVVNVALPSIQRDLNLTISEVPAFPGHQLRRPFYAAS